MWELTMFPIVQDLKVIHCPGLAGAKPRYTRHAICTGTGKWHSYIRQLDLISSSIENIRYMVGYIVDLTIILHGLFVSAHGDVSACKVQEVMSRHVESGLQKRIHHDIRRFITDDGQFTYRGNDLVVEKMIDLIKKFCVPPAAIRRSA